MDKDKRIKEISELYKVAKNISDDLIYHIENNISVLDNLFRPTSESYFNLISEAKRNIPIIKASSEEISVLNTDIGSFGYYNGNRVPIDFPMPDEEFFEKRSSQKRRKSQKKNQS